MGAVTSTFVGKWAFADKTSLSMFGAGGVSCSADDKLACFEIDHSGGAINSETLTLGSAGVGDVCMRPDGKLFVAGCWQGRVEVFSCKKRHRRLALLKVKDALA